jgi:hypothetical protein
MSTTGFFSAMLASWKFSLDLASFLLQRYRGGIQNSDALWITAISNTFSERSSYAEQQTNRRHFNAHAGGL